MPQITDGPDLREKAMATDIETEAVVLDRARDPADLLILFDDGDVGPFSNEDVRRRQAGRSGANDDSAWAYRVRHVGDAGDASSRRNTR